MTEDRPKPRYGEYATPQSQAEAIADSMPPVSPLLAARANPAASSAVSDSATAGAAGASSPGDTLTGAAAASAATDTPNPPSVSSHSAASHSAASKSGAPKSVAPKTDDASWWAPVKPVKSIKPENASGTRPRRRWDLVLTIALLAYGALNVVSQVGQYSDITGFLNRMATLYPAFGLGTVTPTGREAAVGLGINVINLVLYLGTLLLSVRRLRQRKLSFFVPLIGGAVAALAAAILLSTILGSNPGFMGAVTSGI